MANAATGSAVDNWPDELDWGDLPPPIQNAAAQGQNLGYNDVGYHHDIANYLPPLHEDDPAINIYAGAAALDRGHREPAQAQAGPPDAVCADLTFSHMHLTSPLALAVRHT